MLDKESRAITKALSSLTSQNVGKYVVVPKPKNKISSEKARLQGNKLFKRTYHDLDSHEYIWQKYTTSIALAPLGSEELAMAYANRSALFFHMLKFEDCLVDVDRAVGIVKSNVLKAKWLCRKVKCFHALGDLVNAEKTLQEAKVQIDLVTERNEDDLKVVELIEATEELLTTEYSKPLGVDDPKIPVVKMKTDDFSNVTDKYNSKFGRHLVATRDIAPGEVIFVEKPYCVSILQIKKAYPFCSHCYAACLTTIPCDSCPLLMFCSEKCKKEAWDQYHDIECLILGDSLLKKGSENFLQMVVRCSIAECRNSGGIASLRNLLQTIMKKKDNPSEKLIVNGELKTSKFKLLCDFVKSLSSCDSEEYSDVMLFMIISMAVNTSFFGKKFKLSECRSLANNKDVVFLGSFMLKIAKYCSNGLVISNVRDLFRRRADLNSAIGSCIPSVFTCLLKHNCDPSASRTYSQSNDLMVYALKPIKKDDQIFITYGENYRISPKMRRQFDIYSNHEFFCDCQACEEDWPPLLLTTDDLMTRKPKNFERQLFKTPLELELYKKHEHIIEKNYMPIYDFHPTEQMLTELGQSIEIALRNLPQPSNITCFLFSAINLVCSLLYSHVYPIPDKCVTSST